MDNDKSLEMLFLSYLWLLHLQNVYQLGKLNYQQNLYDQS